MRVQEWYVNIVLALGSLAAMLFVIPAWTPESQGYGLSASTLPQLLCGAMALLSALQIVKGLRCGLRRGGGPVADRELVWHLIKYFGVMALIFPAWEYLGFVPGGMLVLGLLYGVTRTRNVKVAAGVGVLLPVVCYVLLWYGLHIPTP